MISTKTQVSALPPARNREMTWKMPPERTQLNCPVILMESWTENLSRANNGIAGPSALVVINDGKPNTSLRSSEAQKYLGQP